MVGESIGSLDGWMLDRQMGDELVKDGWIDEWVDEVDELGL